MRNDDIIRVALELRDAANQPNTNIDFARGIDHAISCLADATSSCTAREGLRYIVRSIRAENRATRDTADAFVGHYWPNAAS